MGRFIDEQGRFQSDKYPDLAPDKIVVSFKDPHARRALGALAIAYNNSDHELATAIRTRLTTFGSWSSETHGRS